MSHFMVFVVTDDGEYETVEQALAPFHEYECTGVDDEYVVDVDITADALERYDKEMERRAHLQKFPDEAASYEMHLVERQPRTFLEFCSAYYEYPLSHDQGSRIEVNDGNVTVIRHTNPNAKWDWWVVGGRYAQASPLYDPHAGQIQQARVGSMEFDELAERQRERRQAWLDDALQQYEDPDAAIEAWDAAAEVGGWPSLVKAFHDVREADESIGQARDWALALPEDHPLRPVRDAIELGVIGDWMKELPVPETRTVAEWLDAPLELRPFAWVVDGEWIERGSMGWWAIVTDEKPEGDWLAACEEIKRNLKPEQWITVVDCHI